MLNGYWVVKEGRKLSRSKHNCLYFVFFIIRLTTCFGPCAGPSSGHKIYKEENYTVRVLYSSPPSTRAETCRLPNNKENKI